VTHIGPTEQPAIAHSPCILVVEDEMLVAMMLEDMLTDIGYRVVKASRLTKAASLAATADIDCAILDVNLDGETSYPVANALRQRGIPFLFSTGYNAASLNESYREFPVLAKPYSPQDLQQALEKSLGSSLTA